MLIIHGVGFDREQFAADARTAAGLGYLAITYDVRGQGDSMDLNDPNVYGRGPLGLRERLDLFEILEETKSRFSPEMDFNRIGVTGKSQGAFLTLCAVAHSGRVPPFNIWRTAPFPQIHAAAPQNFPPDMMNAVIPEGTAFTEKQIYDLYFPKVGVHNDPAFMAMAEPFMFAEDYAGLTALVDDPELDLVELLKTSQVPVRATLSFDDVHFPVNLLTDIWNDILPNTPKLLNFAVGGHSTPDNQHEQALRAFRRDQWFDHFLRGVDNGIDLTPEVRIAIRPSHLLEYQNVDSLWDFREFQSWPPPATELQLWLSGEHRLKTKLGRAGYDFIYNIWQEHYTIRSYVRDLPTVLEIQNLLPHWPRLYDSNPMPSDTLICGVPKARLWVSTPAPEFQVHIALIDVALNGDSNFITGGHTTIRGNQDLGPQLLEFDLSAYAYVLPKGHRLRLLVENLAWSRPPFGEASVLRALPVFDDYSVKYYFGGAFDSGVTVPIVDYESPSLVCSEVTLKNGMQRDIRLAIHSDEERAGLNYFMLAGYSGSNPGVVWNGLQVPLNVDWLTESIWNQSGFVPSSAFDGSLDNKGRAEGVLQLAGFSLYWPIEALTFVGVIYYPGVGAQVTNPVSVPLH